MRRHISGSRRIFFWKWKQSILQSVKYRSWSEELFSSFFCRTRVTLAFLVFVVFKVSFQKLQWVDDRRTVPVTNENYHTLCKYYKLYLVIYYKLIFNIWKRTFKWFFFESMKWELKYLSESSLLYRLGTDLPHVSNLLNRQHPHHRMSLHLHVADVGFFTYEGVVVRVLDYRGFPQMSPVGRCTLHKYTYQMPPLVGIHSARCLRLKVYTYVRYLRLEGVHTRSPVRMCTHIPNTLGWNVYVPYELSPIIRRNFVRRHFYQNVQTHFGATHRKLYKHAMNAR